MCFGKWFFSGESKIATKWNAPEIEYLNTRCAQLAVARKITLM
jgi:hypothetical protein